LAAGCNKPADDTAEETVEVVRNHEDGTSFGGGTLEAEATTLGSAREWTLGRDVDGGAKRHIVRHSCRAVWTNPGEKAVESARAKGEGSEVERRGEVRIGRFLRGPSERAAGGRPRG
jgi:hypothetical protein